MQTTRRRAWTVPLLAASLTALPLLGANSALAATTTAANVAPVKQASPKRLARPAPVTPVSGTEVVTTAGVEPRKTPVASPSPSSTISPTPTSAPVASGSPSGGLPAPAADDGTTLSDTFDGYGSSVWSQGGRYGDWAVEFNGYGTVKSTLDGANGVLELWPSVDPDTSVGTTAALVSHVRPTTGDVVMRASLRTLAQNGPLRRVPQVANPWEVAWLYWNYSRSEGLGDQGTGVATNHVRKGYYLALKPNGWELGKLDQSVFPGGQRFLATGSLPAFPVGSTWRDVTVEQRGAQITVSVGGSVLTTYTDGPGSSGSPAWGTAGETVFTSGAAALYTEDARVQFDDVSVTGRTS